MPALKPGEPVIQDDPFLLVENRLSPGRYRFQLVVTDNAGLESAPAEVLLLVNEVVKPVGPVIGPKFNPQLFEKLEAVKPVIKPVIAEPVKPKINPAILKNINLFKPK